MRRDECRTCEESILWCVTTKGSNMPVDADPVPDGNLILLPSNGKTVAQVVGPSDVVDSILPRYKSHFATCGQADAWRNR